SGVQPPHSKGATVDAIRVAQQAMVRQKQLREECRTSKQLAAEAFSVEINLDSARKRALRMQPSVREVRERALKLAGVQVVDALGQLLPGIGNLLGVSILCGCVHDGKRGQLFSRLRELVEDVE